ncbi:MAG: hypothetical protein SF051_03710, partial [Elusimicrobiota bacterium]|nr:hypothetical protein [Elusimicrobiota bacterium]
PAEAPSDAASAAAPSAAPGAAPAAASAPAPAAQEPPAARPLPPHDFTLPPARVNLTETGILMRGWIYDLATARPVPHAVVQLQDRLSGAVHAASAGPDGYYELMLPRENSGLRPAASVAGYRREVLEENGPPWHARKPASRKAAAAREPDEVLLTFAPSQEEALFNLILIPLPEKRR